MRVGWSSLKNKLFEHKKQHSWGSSFQILLLIWNMHFNCEFIWQFLRFQDSPIHLDRTWSCLSCPEALQIWPPSEQTLLERDFGCTSSIATLLTKTDNVPFFFLYCTAQRDSPKWKILSYLFTLMAFHTCMTFFLLWSTNEDNLKNAGN